jgi:hypothetical protein
MDSEPILLMTGVDCAPGKEKEFNEWYNSGFPPAMMKVPGVVRVDRYERVEEDERLPKFLSVMHFESIEATEKMAENEAVQALGKSYFEEGSKFDIEFRWSIRYKRIYTTQK